MFLTSGQLYDLLSKAKKKATQTGPRGGKFYVSTEGSKVYTGEPSVTPPPTRPSPVVHHFISAAPHSSTKTQSPVSVEANVEITKLPMRQKVVPAEQRFRPKAKSTPSSRVSVKEMMKRWPAYVCRSCRAVILPTFAKDTKKNRVLEVKLLTHKDQLGKLHSVGWQVHTEEEGVRETYNTDSKAEAEALAEDLRQHFQEEEPWQKKDELLAVHKTVIEGESKHHTLLEVGDIQPEMIGKKLCPDCFGKHEVISREVTGRTEAPKPTRESRKAARQREQEQKQKARTLEGALKKFPGKRTEAEQQLVAEHEAIQNTRQRAEDEKRKQHRRAQGRKGSEEVWIESQEQAALAKLRHYYRDRLIRQGKEPAEAAREAANLSDAELRKFQDEMTRAHAKRREETIKEIEAESGGRRVVPVASGYEIEEHMERRRHGVAGGEERGIYKETFHPVEAKIADLLRTARLRERMEEKETQEKKTKKSLCVFLNKAVFDPEYQRKIEEAKQRAKKIEVEYQASKKPSPHLPPMGGEAKKPQDVHLAAAYHLTHVFHHLDRTSHGHEDAFKHHWEAARKLIQDHGADPKHEHYDKVGDHHQRIADDIMMSRPQAVDRNVGSRASKHNFHRRMSSVAAHLFHMSSAAHRLRQRVANSSSPPDLRTEAERP